MSDTNNNIEKTLNVAELLCRRDRVGEDSVAFIDESGQLRYGELRRDVARCGALLRALGVRREERVVILLPDKIDAALAFLGTLWIGAVGVPLNPSAPPDKIRFTLRDCRARIVVTDDRGQALLDDIVERDALVLTDDAWRLNLAAQDQDAAVRTSPHESALWLYTSGSTGTPKGVIHSHHDVLVCARCYGQWTIGLQPTDRCFSVAPMSFAYGLGNSLYLPLFAGASAVLRPTLSVFDAINTINAHRPTVFWAIPSIYADILAVDSIAPLDTGSLRVCISAAEPLPESTWHKFRERYGLEICEGLGTTECLHIVVSNRPGSCRPGWVGRAVPGYITRLLDDSGDEVAPGQRGRLEVTGDSLMLGYWNRHQATRAAIDGYSTTTGDTCVMDQDGFVRFVGRGDDLIKLRGQWVVPREIEEVLRAHPSVTDCAVITAQTDGRDVTVTAYVSTRDYPPKDDLVQELRRLTRKRLSSQVVPSSVRIMRDLPRTPTGKIDRHALSPERTGKVQM